MEKRRQMIEDRKNRIPKAFKSPLIEVSLFFLNCTIISWFSFYYFLIRIRG